MGCHELTEAKAWSIVMSKQTKFNLMFTASCIVSLLFWWGLYELVN